MTKNHQENYQILVADDDFNIVMMPRCSGLLATMRIREKSNIPILILSAKAEGSDRVLGLEAGADDYLVKPFYQQELLARLLGLWPVCAPSAAPARRDRGRLDQCVDGNRQCRICTRGFLLYAKSPFWGPDLIVLVPGSLLFLYRNFTVFPASVIIDFISVFTVILLLREF
jgi:hypothetical protein